MLNDQSEQFITAEIRYHQAEHPLLLDSYYWQDFDDPKQLLRLKEFLFFLKKSIDGTVHSIHIMVGNKTIDYKFNDHNAFF